MNNKIINKYIFLNFSIIISGVILFLSTNDQIIIHMISLLILTITAIIIINFDFLHPYFWFSAIFYLYSIGYPFIYIFYKDSFYTKYGYSKEIMILQWIALSVFLIVLSPKKRK